MYNKLEYSWSPRRKPGREGKQAQRCRHDPFAASFGQKLTNANNRSSSIAANGAAIDTKHEHSTKIKTKHYTTSHIYTRCTMHDTLFLSFLLLLPPLIGCFPGGAFFRVQEHPPVFVPFFGRFGLCTTAIVQLQREITCKQSRVFSPSRVPNGGIIKLSF